MTLAAGARLGPYEIESLLGAGGFGEVYKARDARLGRLVALKVLLPAIAEDATFRERFEREARVISQLAHPNICTLYDVGREGTTEYLVMEYLEGETLAARLQQGALPIDETMKIGLQIADALACAHGGGIMHRDLKPANVFLTKNGVKLLDFGLAKPAVLAGGPADVTTPVAPRAVTAQGTILGTLQYMAPEQVEGLDTDSRVDIWAFGAMLHEMITGRAAFEARTPATLIAAVLTHKPQPVRAVNPEAPAALERLIAGCLEKDREQRWQSIRDVRRQLAAATAVDESPTAPVAPEPAATRPRSLTLAIALAAIVLGIGAFAGYVVAARLGRAAPDASVVRFEIGPPAGATIQHFSDLSLYIAPSPDGTRLAFVAGGKLWLKALDSAKAEEVAGAAGARSPFWSPDGRSLAFFGGGQLKTKLLDGGAPQTVCAVRGNGNNGSWNAEGTILFAEWGENRILRVPAQGGAPTVVRTGPVGLGFPQFLPDGRHFLYAELSIDQPVQAFVGSLDANDATPIAGVASMAQYVDGHLLFRQDGGLVAQPFDTKTFKLTGSAQSIAEFVSGFASTGFAAFSATPRLLVYQSIASANRLVWIDREGRDLETIGQPRDYAALRLSPDGQALAVTVRDARLGTNDIWVHDFKRNLDTHLTNEKNSENGPVWSPDGRTIFYGADRRGPPHVHARDVTGSDEREITPPSIAVQVPTGVTPDGRFVVYTDTNRETGLDVMMKPADGNGPPVALVHTKARENGGRPSPDGKWLAYLSDESGRFELYVRPFSGGQTRWQISRAGGGNARWRGDSRELFYIEGATRVMSVDISTANGFEVSAPRVLFSRDAFADYDVTADGKRFVASILDPEAEAGTLNAILNWTSLLRR